MEPSTTSMETPEESTSEGNSAVTSEAGTSWTESTLRAMETFATVTMVLGSATTFSLMWLKTHL